MSTANPEVMNDIIESIKVHLTEVALGEEALTIDQLIASWEGSGEPTERAWVEEAANALVVSGDIEGGEDPNRPLMPSHHYILQIRAKDASRTFPNDKTNIELIPHESNPAAAPVWRLVIWRQPEVGPFARSVSIEDVAEADRSKLGTLLRMTRWRIRWHHKVVNEAVKKLGLSRLVSESPRSDSPELKIRIYEDSIRAQFNTGPEEGNVMEYDLRSCEWRAL